MASFDSNSSTRGRDTTLQVHVEYVIAIKRGALLKTLGKRYSELHEFHNLLVEHDLVDRVRAPPFPEKQSFRDGWYKFDSTDVQSDFVRARADRRGESFRRLTWRVCPDARRGIFQVRPPSTAT